MNGANNQNEINDTSSKLFDGLSLMNDKLEHKSLKKLTYRDKSFGETRYSYAISPTVICLVVLNFKT